MSEKYLFTSESVTEGHPDKMADQISDAVLDAIISQDKQARVACETFLTTGYALISGEITTDCYVNVSNICRDVICDIGYDTPEYGFDGNTCGVVTSIDEQSPDIARGVNGTDNNEKELGAGDQGIMFGYACRETEEYMPLPIMLAHKLAKQLTKVRKNGTLPYLRPDGKTQVTVEYEDGQAIRLDKILLSTQHDPDVSLEQIKKDIITYVIKPIVVSGFIDDNTEILVNPTGRFVIGGPQGDTGLTGRKIIIDTYGGSAHHGGGAFSGKDPTKVDRSATYAARHVAKNIVAAGLADRCEVQLSYAIGVSRPLSVNVNTFGTGKFSASRLVKAINDVFDLRPAAIIEKFALLRPIYRPLAAYGHFGRKELDLPWEETEMARELKSVVENS
ncbi:MAG: methionine adenosyltransferase [Halanaerobiaceae bacterium]